MESQGLQLIRAARKKTAQDKIWLVLSTIVILGTCITLAIVYWPEAEAAAPPEESAILMLSTLRSTNVPWVISLNGEFD